MKSKLPPTLEKLWKTAVGPSLISSFTPNALTPTQKMILARARIWGDIIGGNLRTGNRYARSTFKGEGMMNYFNGAFPDFIFPYEMQDEDDDEENDDLDSFREIRNSRKGKILVLGKKVPLKDVPKYKAKRYLLSDRVRKEQEAKSGLSKKSQKNPNPPA